MTGSPASHADARAVVAEAPDGLKRPRVALVVENEVGSRMSDVARRLARWSGLHVIDLSLAGEGNPGIITPPQKLDVAEAAAWLASHLAAVDVVVCNQAVPMVARALATLAIRPAVFVCNGSGDDQPVRDVALAAASRRRAVGGERLFKSFMQGGFECSTHRRAHDGQRLDMVAASGHDRHALHDYRMLGRHGIRTVREGLRWHLVERVAGRYDWSSLEAQLDAANLTKTEVIWDLMHYGWPDHLDIWSSDFPHRFADFAAAAARHIRSALPGPRWYAPVNEISFFAWAGAEVGAFNPSMHGYGTVLKRQLVRASVKAMAAIRVDDPAARFIQPEPAIHVIPHPDRPHDAAAAEAKRRSQFEAWDMIAGRDAPELGGSASFLDVIGVNYYVHNQWHLDGGPIEPGSLGYRPLRDLLMEIYARYGRPILIAETGIEGERRPDWLRYVATETAAAMTAGVPMQGICLYPVLDHPGWLDGRYCANGLLANREAATGRCAFGPLAEVVDWCGSNFGEVLVADAAPAVLARAIMI